MFFFDIPSARIGVRMFSVKRVSTCIYGTTYVGQVYVGYMKNPPFNSLVWGSLRLAPNDCVPWLSRRMTACWSCTMRNQQCLCWRKAEGVRVTCIILFKLVPWAIKPWAVPRTKQDSRCRTPPTLLHDSLYYENFHRLNFTAKCTSPSANKLARVY